MSGTVTGDGAVCMHNPHTVCIVGNCNLHTWEVAAACNADATWSCITVFYILGPHASLYIACTTVHYTHYCLWSSQMQDCKCYIHCNSHYIHAAWLSATSQASSCWSPAEHAGCPTAAAQGASTPPHPPCAPHQQSLDN